MSPAPPLHAQPRRHLDEQHSHDDARRDPFPPPDLAGELKAGGVSVALIAEDELVSSIPPEMALDPNTIVAYDMNRATG